MSICQANSNNFQTHTGNPTDIISDTISIPIFPSFLASESTALNKKKIKNLNITAQGDLIYPVNSCSKHPEIRRVWGEQHITKMDQLSRQQQKRAKTREKKRCANFDSHRKQKLSDNSRRKAETKTKKKQELSQKNGNTGTSKSIPYYDIRNDIITYPITPISGDTPHTNWSLIGHTFFSKLSATGEALVAENRIQGTANPNRSYSYKQWMQILVADGKERTNRIKQSTAIQSHSPDKLDLTTNNASSESVSNAALSKHRGFTLEVVNSIKAWLGLNSAQTPTLTNSEKQGTTEPLQDQAQSIRVNAKNNEASVEDESFFATTKNCRTNAQKQTQTSEYKSIQAELNAAKPNQDKTVLQVKSNAQKLNQNLNKSVLNRHKRMANGYELTPKSFLKYSVASINTKSGLCSGSFISKDKVITNRHCIHLFPDGVKRVEKEVIDRNNSMTIGFQGKNYPCKTLFAPSNDDYYYSTEHPNKQPDMVICQLKDPILNVAPLQVVTGNRLQNILQTNLDRTKAPKQFPIPHVLTVSDGATYCSKTNGNTGIHSGHRIAWFDPEYTSYHITHYPENLELKPRKGQNGKYNLVCGADSGSATLLLDPDNGNFVLGGVLTSRIPFTETENSDNSIKNAFFESFADNNTAKWIESHASNTGPFYNSTMDPDISASIPKDNPKGANFPPKALKEDINLTLNLDFVSLNSEANFALLKQVSNYSGIIMTRACAAFTGFPCRLILPKNEIPLGQTVLFSDKSWTRQANNNTDFTVHQEKYKYSLKVKKK